MGNFAENLNLGNRFRPPPEVNLNLYTALSSVLVILYFLNLWLTFRIPYHFIRVRIRVRYRLELGWGLGLCLGIRVRDLG